MRTAPRGASQQLLRTPAARDTAPAHRAAREPLRTDPLDQGAKPPYPPRADPDGRLPAQAQHPDPDTGSGTPIVTRQPPAHHGGHRYAYRAPTGTLQAKEGNHFPPRSPPPILVSRSQAHSHLLPTDRPALTPAPADSGRTLAATS